MSHELRTPLTAILGWARLLVAGNLDEAEQAQAIESIARNARSQAQLIDDLLDVSRIITGKMRLDVREIDLSHVIAGALASILPAAHAKEIRIEPRIEPLPRVSGDAGRLQQVLWNLLSNAVKFTPHRGRIIVEARAVGGGVEVEVTDDGSGIAPDFLPHVFDRFRQGPAQASSRRGLGLGLAIARHLVELHGGVIFAHSEGLGRGAKFRVALPSLAPAKTTSKRVPTPAFSKVPSEDCLRGVRVTVVDDEADTRQVLRLMLEHAGARVDLASSADEAREVVRRVRPTLLVCDIGLGGEDGYSLLRTLHPPEGEGTAKMRAVALTAHARSEDKAQALAAGFDLHIAKPGPPDLPEILAGLLREDGGVEVTAS
jgi:CheY-like chemotaxis protein